MRDKRIVYTEKAPKPKGAYSQAIIHNGLLYISGQIPIDPKTGTLKKGNIKTEAELVLSNIRIIAEEAGAGMGDFLKVTCYLDDLEDLEIFNNIYKKYFQQDPPARTTIQADGLPLNVRIEIDAIVALPVINTDERG